MTPIRGSAHVGPQRHLLDGTGLLTTRSMTGGPRGDRGPCLARRLFGTGSGQPLISLGNSRSMSKRFDNPAQFAGRLYPTDGDIAPRRRPVGARGRRLRRPPEFKQLFKTADWVNGGGTSMRIWVRPAGKGQFFYRMRGDRRRGPSSQPFLGRGA